MPKASIAPLSGSAASNVEAELRAALAMHKATLEAAAEGILVTDSGGRITSVNQRFIDMWRVPPEVRASSDCATWAAWGATQCSDPTAGAGGY
jgi:two-component system sensor histidine kinase/response regulator